MANEASLRVTPGQRGELQAHLRRRNLPASVAQRIRIVLLLDEGLSHATSENKFAFQLPRLRDGSAATSKRDCSAGHHSSGPATKQVDAGATSPRTGADPATTSGRLDALVVAKDGGGDEGQQESGRPDLARGRAETTSAGALHGFQRSAV
jgi:hypothetical protein